MFVKKGNDFLLHPRDALDLHQQLPVGNYTVNTTREGALYLTQLEPFKPNGKLYGDTVKNAARILTTFKDRKGNTGVLLSGEKGSGKTLLMRTVSLLGYEMQLPTIIINTPYQGDVFNQFIQNINQPAIIQFDEFEKVYSMYSGEDKVSIQDGLLTLLDGTFQTKKLFMLTTNDPWRIDEHMRNRPGRLYYMLEFHGLEEQFVIEYCQDVLNNKDHIPTIVKVTQVFDKFNFDMLKALVEEMNRYDEDPINALRMLNIKPYSTDRSRYTITVTHKGEELEPNEDEFYSTPLVQEMIRIFVRPKGSTDNFSTDLRFFQTDRRSYTENKVVYAKDGYELTLTRVKPQENIHNPVSWLA